MLEFLKRHAVQEFQITTVHVEAETMSEFSCFQTKTIVFSSENFIIEAIQIVHSLKFIEPAPKRNTIHGRSKQFWTAFVRKLQSSGNSPVECLIDTNRYLGCIHVRMTPND